MLPTYEEALAAVVHSIEAQSETELIPISSSIGRFLARNIVADRDVPPFNRSQMDGYAVRASEVKHGVKMNVIGQVAAGSMYKGEGLPMTCVSIATGAPVPDCYDAVVPHEKTDNGKIVVEFHCDDAKKYACMHLQGVDAKEGDIVIPKHVKIAPQHVGICASVGVVQVPLLSMPKVIVITSGDEVVAMDATPQVYQIRNGNNPMVSQGLLAMGCDVIAQHHVQDDPVLTSELMRETLDGRADVVVTIGGISAGERDYFPKAFATLGVDIIVKGANIQPGKPVLIGKCKNTVVLALPGNPVSALVCCCIFGWPIVQSLLGSSTRLPWQFAPLAHDVKPNPKRVAFRPCVLNDGKVHVPTWQGSGDLLHTAETNGLVQLPPSYSAIEVGTVLPCLAYPWL